MKSIVKYFPYLNKARENNYNISLPKYLITKYYISKRRIDKDYMLLYKNKLNKHFNYHDYNSDREYVTVRQKMFFVFELLELIYENKGLSFK